MNTVFLLLGGNLGDRRKILENAIALIARRAGKIKKSSSIYETAAWGKIEQPDYLNQALMVETTLTARQLLETTLLIESDMGRVRKKIWEPRLIDIDILFFNRDIIRLKHLKIPHPHLQYRRFVLVPLTEIAPDFIHPVLETSISQLLKQCSDPLEVRKFPVTIPG
jgi:2-amino-4-hydroxy-6-hydroxymethyldihydropteridine diphosphokinase